MTKPLTKKQKQVLDFIKDFITEKSYPPTLEEIKGGLNLSAVSTIHEHINILVEKGHLKKIDNSARAIELSDQDDSIEAGFVQIPLLGYIAAGEPIEAVEAPQIISVPKEFISRSGKHYALRVQGHSMQEADIYNGDVVVIRDQKTVENGEIGVAIVDGKATLKRIYRERNRFRLQPANRDYRPIFVTHLEIRGKLTGVVRSRFDLITKVNTIPLTKVSDRNIQKLQIYNRRFLGNKSKLLGFISDIVAEKCPDYNSFCDIFAGTGVVGHHFSRPGVKVISNDILDSSYASLNCWMGTTDYDIDRISNVIDYLNILNVKKQNYVSKNFGGSFFTKKNALKIGAIRDEIDHLKVTEQEKYILLTSLIYAMDKVANTVGHYDAYRKTLDNIQNIKLLVPDLNAQNNQFNEIYNKDANELIREVKCDILYIDPPYNSRQYGDAYHLLENVVTWKHPKVEGVAKKMTTRDHLKSKYCLKDAAQAFKDLILNADTKHILLSYNNTGEKKNQRSNARISDKQIMDTLKLRGEVEIFERDYRGFTTGKSDTEGHSERVFYCRVKK